MAVNTTSGTGSATAVLGLSISESWIRERLNLHKDSLDDVRSLSLPGSYSEKITLLGRSLVGFTRLKHLDLARNAIESLDGLDHLKCLESLNLYYNNVSSLKEVFKLGHNTKLKELDLRLNPVTKNEPDYRLFVVHMLVNLRKLDDRSVRDSERRAALLHFDTDQAYKFDGQFEQAKKIERENDPQRSATTGRSDLIKSLAPRPTALEDDTDQLLELITHSNHLNMPPGYFSHHPHSTASEGTHHHHHRRPNMASSKPRTHLKAHPPELATPLNARATDITTPPHHHHHHLDLSGEGGYREQEEMRGGFLHQPPSGYRVRGNFTPAPPGRLGDGDGAGVGCDEGGSSQLALRELLALLQEHIEGDLSVLLLDPTFQSRFKEWHGCHTHVGRGLAAEGMGQVDSLQGEIEALQSELRATENLLRDKDRKQETKNKKIREMEELLGQQKEGLSELSQQLQDQVAMTEEVTRRQGDMEDSNRQLQQTQLELSSLQQQVCTLQSENRSLHEVLNRTPSASQLEQSHRQMGKLQAENQALKRELEAIAERHKQDLLGNSQIKEMAVMLQESHKSLMATNEHLLQELEEAKQRHSQEVLQMSNNYEQLRKTVQLYS